MGETLYVAAAGQTTWAQFAAQVMAASEAAGGAAARIVPIATAEYTTRTSRPSRSVFDTFRFTEMFSCHPPTRQSMVTELVTRLVKQR